VNAAEEIGVTADAVAVDSPELQKRMRLEQAETMQGELEGVGPRTMRTGRTR
jgi:hypothetical protein